MKNFPIALTMLISFWFTPAHAALIVDTSGQLTGATDLIVDGAIYDVEFVDGKCIDFYGGCDQSSDFTFKDINSANLASRALRNIFTDSALGLFDSHPELTAGCSLPLFECALMTPYLSSTGLVRTQAFVNSRTESRDHLGPKNVLNNKDFSLDGLAVFARWTKTGTVPIPSPSTLMLFMSGLLGLMTLRRGQAR